MRVVARRLTGLVMAGILLSACSDQPGPSSIDDTPASAVVAGCDLVKSFSYQFKSFVGNPVPKTITEALRDLGTACGNGDQAATSSIAWGLISTIESLYGQHLTGDPGIGSQIVNGLLACTTSLCSSAALPGVDFSHALGNGGIFAVHSTDSNASVARDVINTLDFSGNALTALWGVEVGAPWNVVTATPQIILYGGPVLQGGLSLNEISIGNMQYKLDIYPDAGEFVGDNLHVGVCFSSEITLPPNAQGLEARLRREGVILEDYQPLFCPPAGQNASVLAPVFSLIRRFMPAATAMTDTKIRVVGGTPLDFSRFAPVAAKVAGQLSFETPPNPNPTAGESIGDVRVKVVTGDGTPVEKILVQLYIQGNNGLPAGAGLLGDLDAYTQERNGVQGIASFPDQSPISFGKAGGYRLCATAVTTDFTFADICTSYVINVKNAN